MSFFKVPLFRSDSYLAWVRTLSCANCNRHGPSEAHHRIGHGRVGTMKTSDIEAMPLCTECHASLHNLGWVQFEQAGQDQTLMVLRTINQAIAVGVLGVDRKVAEDLAR